MKSGLKTIAVLFTAITLLMAGSFSPAVLAGPAQQDALRLDLQPVTTLDPALASFTNEVQVITQLFAGLVRLDPETGAVLPDLAQSWAWNADQTELTFTLRPGLVWSDGQPLTAADARYSILRALDPLMQAPYASILFAIQNAEDYNTGVITDANLVGVYADSDTALRFVLNTPMVFFDRVLSLVIARPVPEQAISAHPGDWTDPANMVVSGAYSLSQQSEQAIQLLPNPHYYGATPDINQVDYLITQDGSNTWQAYLAGDLDTMNLLFFQVAPVLADPLLAAQFRMTPFDCTFVLAYNTNTAAFANADVRRAFTAAIDRQDMIEQTLAGVGLAAQTFASPGMFGYVDGEALGIGIPSSAAAAQAYLAAAGYPGGAGFPVTIVQVRDSPANRGRWDYLIAAWQNVLSVPVSVVYVASPANGQAVNFTGWCADYNEAYNFVGDGVNFLRNTSRIGLWSNPAYEALIAAIPQTADEPARRLLYQQAEQILVEDDAVVGPLFNTVNSTLTRPYLQRTYAASTIDPISAWVIETADSSDYNPAAAQVFEPGVDAVSYNLPAGLFYDARHLLHTTLRGPEMPAAPAGFGDIGTAFLLQAGVPAPAGPQQPADTLLPYTISVAYSPQQLTSAGIDSEADLALYAQVGLGWVLLDTTVDSVNHTLSASTTLMDTRFVAWGRNANSVYLPFINRP